ncbi:MAG: NosD domain-containing protein [Candidatus Cohnella colombiensis]|uniref:NosD domain-containing protein n=1 Tax=Candidatus Cohnella colombiensis TaxID=3121368 RepID=A0AA95F6I6_9BACL|nr:MAG: NosD domain-containing protein [Cohnella sp.]
MRQLKKRQLFGIVTIAFALTLLMSVDAVRAADNNELQQIIDGASPGDKIVLEGRSYSGPVLINKPLTLQGQSGSVIASDSGEAAIEVTADEVVIEHLTIITDDYGIKLRGADRGTISHNVIRWSGAKQDETSHSMESNGIDLYDSHDNRIENNEISNMKDAIYIENSHRSIVEGNRLFHSRYGIHCMYTDATKVINNYGEFNITGAMVMGVHDVLVSGNTFSKQSENANSQGILLFDVLTSQIEDNVVEGNRVGIYMELSYENTLRNNAVLRNFIGIQFLESTDNDFTNNEFISNVIEAEALNSTGNRMDSNYWDAVQGLDTNDDGHSDLTYAINPFYQQVTKKQAAFQLFFQSPSMNFLSNLYTDNQEQWSHDASPLMNLPQIDPQNEEHAPKSGWSVALLSLLLLGAATTTIYMGVRKS